MSLTFAQALGWRDLEGVELSPEAAEAARRATGATVHGVDLPRAPLPSGHFAAVTLWDVLEHLADPRGALCRVRDLLRPGGVLVVATPNRSGITLRALGSRTLVVTPPEHMFLASRRGLAHAVTAEGLVERLLVQNFIAMPSPMFDRAAALRLGGMDESLWFTADWDFWLRLARMGPVRYLRRPLAAFRLHPASQTMARASDGHSRRQQLLVVLERNMAAWAGDPVDAPRVRRTAEFSVEVNVALAGAARGEAIPWRDLLRRWLRLGPRGWLRYWRDSRILERVGARLRLRCRRARADRTLSPSPPAPARSGVPSQRGVQERAEPNLCPDGHEEQADHAAARLVEGAEVLQDPGDQHEGIGRESGDE